MGQHKIIESLINWSFKLISVPVFILLLSLFVLLCQQSSVGFEKRAVLLETNNRSGINSCSLKIICSLLVILWQNTSSIMLTLVLFHYWSWTAFRFVSSIFLLLLAAWAQVGSKFRLTGNQSPFSTPQSQRPGTNKRNKCSRKHSLFIPSSPAHSCRK